MPMSSRLLRPIASGLHPEAQVWRNAVIANSGTVSASTVKAVSDFCKSIDAAGIRDRFYRLNLLCGTGLNAALVPLYRGQSRTGTQLGNATDTNNGPFVSGDFTSSGLKGDGLTKSLDTTLPQNAGSLSNLHMSLSFTELEASGAKALLTNNGRVSFPPDFTTLQADANLDFFASSSTPLTTTRTTAVSHFMGCRSSNTRSDMYVDGASVAFSTATVTPAAQATTYRLFGRQDLNFILRTAMRLRFYSIGTAIDGASATAFANAVAALNTALGR